MKNKKTIKNPKPLRFRREKLKKIYKMIRKRMLTRKTKKKTKNWCNFSNNYTKITKNNSLLRKTMFFFFVL